MEKCNEVLTFKSVDETLWCDYSNQTSSAVPWHGTIFFGQYFTNLNLGFFLKFDALVNFCSFTCILLLASFLS